MKRFATLLLRLYPKAWRHRYGDEINALIEDHPFRPSLLPDLARGALKEHFNMQSFTRLVGWLSTAGLIAGFCASYAVTPRYTSHAVISLNTTNASDILYTAQAELTSRQHLAEIINNPRLNLYDREKEMMPMEDVEDQMRQDLALSADHGVVAIAFTYRDPAVAKAAVSDIIDTFAYVIQTDSRKPYVQAYLNDRERKYAEEIARLEAAIAGYEPAPAAPPIKILDPPSLPPHSIWPNRAAFAAAGLGAGILTAFLIAPFRRRPQLTPCPS